MSMLFVIDNWINIQYLINIQQMIEKTTLPLFHFLFTELIEETYSNYEQDRFLQQLHRVGVEIGYRLFSQISIKKQINERPTTINNLMKNIQTKVFKFLFNYEASNFYQAGFEDNDPNQESGPNYLYQVIQDSFSIYLTWMPENLWDVSMLVAGIIEAVCICSGFQCQVSSTSQQMSKSQNALTKYLIKYTEAEQKKWNKKQ